MSSLSQDDTLLSLTQNRQEDEEAAFMRCLKSIPAMVYFLQKDVIYESPGLKSHVAESIIELRAHHFEIYEKQGLPIQGMDLGDVKHYSYLQLQEITRSFDKSNIISNSDCGRLLNGRIKEESRVQEVIVKTWDFFFPLTQICGQYPDKIHDEINILRDPRIRSHPNVVKLIGFHCDRRLAVIYEGGPKKILPDYILSDKFGWNDRLKVAIGIGSVLKLFHDNGIVHGGIDSSNILVDEATYCPKIFNFRTFSHFEECHGLYIKVVFRRYGDCAEKYLAGPVWSMGYDIFAYGILLLELVTKQEYVGQPVYEWIMNYLRDKPKSVLHESFCQDEVFGSRITGLLIACLGVNSDVQASIGTVVCELMDLAKPVPSNKRQKICD